MVTDPINHQLSTIHNDLKGKTMIVKASYQWCRRAVSFFTLGFALALITGCGSNERTAPVGKKAEAPQRIVCGSPAVAEIVFALGCGDRVVGVSDYTVYPPEAKEKESIGGWINPNRERLLVVKPDIIVSQGQHETLAAFADEYGIRFHTVKLDALADIYTAIESIAEALGVVQRGETLNADIRRTIGAVSAEVANAPPKHVLLLFGRTHGSLTGLGTVGPGTFLDDMIRVAGGTNVFADATGAYPQVSKEALLVRKPEVILEVNPGGLEEKTIALLRADWQEFADLPAVRNDRVHYLTNDFLLIPGPRVGQIAEAFAKTITPEAFHE
jgi:iron complex transport system substrate-binding protein